MARDLFAEAGIGGNENGRDLFAEAGIEFSPPKQGFLSKAADLGLGFASGAVDATKALADAAGANNAASRALADADTGITRHLSQSAQDDQQQQSAIMKEAEGKGVYEGVKAGVRAFAVAPLQTAVTGLGSVVPILAGTAATALTGGAAPLVAGGAIGATMGAGTVKGTIFDDIKRRSMAAGMSEVDAIAAATKAQEYGGDNTGSIALGAGLGAADAATGVSAAATRVMRNAIRPSVSALATGSTRGVVGRAFAGMAGEMPLEAMQGGQERYASNTAAQKAGFNADAWDGVVSQATLESLASAGPGAAFGVMHKAAPAPLPDIAPIQRNVGDIANIQTVQEEISGQAAPIPDQQANADALINPTAARWVLNRSDDDLASVLSNPNAGAWFKQVAADELARRNSQQQTPEQRKIDAEAAFGAIAPEQSRIEAQAQAQRRIDAEAAFRSLPEPTINDIQQSGSVDDAIAAAASVVNPPLEAPAAQSAPAEIDTATVDSETIAQQDALRQTDSLQRASDTASIDAEIERNRSTKTSADRMAMLDTVLNDDGIVGIKSKLARFAGDLQRTYGGTVTNPAITEEEWARARRHANATAGFSELDAPAPPAPPVRAMPNEMPSDLVREKIPASAPQVASASILPAEYHDLARESKTTEQFWKGLNALKVPLSGRAPLTAGYKAFRKAKPAIEVTPTIAKSEDISSHDIDKEWTAFSPESGTLGINRSEMPQIKAEHRGAMVNFLNARGISHDQDEVSPHDLKATQREFSPNKVENAKGFTGPDRSILTSSDGHVLDGHHQWLAKRESGDPVKIIRLNAPIKQLLAHVSEFPSAQTAGGSAPTIKPSLPATRLKTRGDQMRANLKAADPFLSLLATEGVSTLDRADIGMERGNLGNRLIPGHGPVFRKSGLRLDELALRALEDGHLTQFDMDRDGGVSKLSDMIRRAVAGKEVIRSDDRHIELRADQRNDDALMQEAASLGINTDGKTADQVYDELVAHDADAIEETADDIDFDLSATRATVNHLTDEEVDALFGLGKATENGASNQEGASGTARGSNQGSATPAEGFSLQGETATEASTRLAEENRRRVDAKADSERADSKAKADAEVGSFALTGSDRKADVGIAQGQGDIFAQAQQAESILDAANITGSERIAALKDVKKGEITVAELARAHPAPENAAYFRDTLPEIPEAPVKSGAAPSLTLTESDLSMAKHAVATLNGALEKSGIPPVQALKTAPTAEHAFAKRIGKEFGIDVHFVTSNTTFEGVSYKGTAYISGNLRSPALAIAGHETLHAMEQSDPAMGERLRQQINQYLLKDTVANRSAWEQARSGGQAVSVRTAESEVLADINGAMWMDPQFWGAMAKADANLFRQAAYRFMQVAAKIVDSLAGTNFDLHALVSDVAAVRAIMVQTWAEHNLMQDSKKVSNAAQFSRATTWDAPAPSMLDDFIYRIQNKHIDLKEVQQAIRATSGQIKDTVNAYLKEELFHGRSATRIDSFLNDELNPLITAMRVGGVTQEEIGQYLWAKHAQEANAHIAKINPGDPDMQDGGSGMTNKEASDYLAALTSGERSVYESLAKRVYAITANTRQQALDYGLISQTEKDAWESAYRFYVPLQREDMETMAHGTGTGQGYSIRGRESKRRTGSSRSVVDILGNIANARDKLVVRGEKNRVGLALYGLVKENPNPDFWTVDKPPVMRVVETIGGVDQVVERIDPMYKSKDNVVMVKMPSPSNGQIEEHAILFNERNERAVRMAASIKNLDGTQMGELLGTAAKITRYFSAINTQYNPIFGVVNLVRDTQGAMINLTDTPLAGKQKQILADVARILAGAIKHRMSDFDGQWKVLSDEFGSVGGKTGFKDMYAVGADRSESIQKALDPDWWAKTSWGKALTANGYLTNPATLMVDKGARPVLDWLSNYNEVMENTVRLAAYKQAKLSGMSIEQSASLAKNLTVNFNRKGEMATQAGALYAFFNASVQGMARMGSALKGPAGMRIIGGGILLGAMQAMLLATADFGDDEPPEFVRERNLILPIGNKKYLTLPMPLGFNVLPNIGRLSMEFALSGGKESMKKIESLLAVMVDATNPLGGSAPLAQIISPTVTDPIVSLGMNKDWTGKPISRDDFNSLNPTPGFTRSKDVASAPAKWLAEAINTLTGGTKYKQGIASPTADQIEYLVGQVTGGVGREVGKVATTVETMFSGEELPEYKMPLIGRFYGATDGQSSQGNAFYANLRTMNEHEATIKGLRKDHKGREAMEYIRDNPESRLFQAANQAERRVSELRKMKRKAMDAGAGKERVKLIENRITSEMLKLNQRVEMLHETQ